VPAPDPFLDVAVFADWFRPLSGAESEVVEPYLQVVSDWIRDRKVGVADNDAAAQVVTFEVTRDALLYGEFGTLISFSKTVGPRSKSGTFDRTAVEKFITNRHRRMLGIPVLAGPRGQFKRCDY
jgi:hypothetical protein